MKKIIFLFLSGIVLISCEKSVEFNDSALQARVNNTFWKATNFNATKNVLSGSLTLTGFAGAGTMMITTSAATKGTYALGGVNQSSDVLYTLIDGTEFSTDITASPVNEITLSSGGTNYAEATSVPTTGGSGNGLTVNILAVNNSNAVTEVEVNAPGEGYKAGDLITITGGAGNAKILVKNVTKSNGEVVITENTGATVSGTFRFTAFDSESGETVLCRDGIFYKVPITLK